VSYEESGPDAPLIYSVDERVAKHQELIAQLQIEVWSLQTRVNTQREQINTCAWIGIVAFIAAIARYAY